MTLSDNVPDNVSDNVPDDARCFALVPCAGAGTRAATRGPKQYERLGPRSVIGHTLAALSHVRRLSHILVVLQPDDTAFETAVPDHTAWVARCGGRTRARSVANGLQALAERGAAPNDWVLVHDAARCLVLPVWIDALIDACVADAVGGLLAWPLADTLKAEHGGRVRATVPRAQLWQAQTPQMFRLGTLRSALANAGDEVTDEAGAMEAAGHAPKLVHGALDNFKLTYAADFTLARQLLAARAAEDAA